MVPCLCSYLGNIDSKLVPRTDDVNGTCRQVDHLNFGTRRLQAHVFDRCLSVSHIHNCIRTLRYQSCKLHERNVQSTDCWRDCNVSYCGMYRILTMSECRTANSVYKQTGQSVYCSCAQIRRDCSLRRLSVCLSVCLDLLASAVVCEVAHARATG